MINKNHGRAVRRAPIPPLEVTTLDDIGFDGDLLHSTGYTVNAGPNEARCIIGAEDARRVCGARDDRRFPKRATQRRSVPAYRLELGYVKR